MHKDCVIIFVFILFSFFFLQQLLCISLVSLFSRYSAQILLEMPYSAGRMLASKNAYSARNSAGRIYPNLTVGGAFSPRFTSVVVAWFSPQSIFQCFEFWLIYFVFMFFWFFRYRFSFLNSSSSKNRFLPFAWASVILSSVSSGKIVLNETETKPKPVY